MEDIEYHPSSSEDDEVRAETDDFERQECPQSSSSCDEGGENEDSSESEKNSARRSKSQMVEMRAKLQQIRTIAIN